MHSARFEPRLYPHLCRWLALASLSGACATSPSTLRLGAAGSERPGVARLSTLDELRAVIGVRDSRSASRQSATQSEAALVVGASSGELLAARLDRAPKEARSWRRELRVSSPPVLTPGLVLLGAGQELLALSPESGQRLWALPSRRQALLAATSNDELLALLLADQRGRRSISVFERASEEGSPPRERLRVAASGSLGTPALLASTLLVPWGDGHLSAVDVRAETELGRVRLGSEPVDALWWRGALFFGPPWLELTGGGAPPYVLPRRPLPGALDVPVPGAPAPASGDVTRLYVRPARTSADAGTPDIYMATYGRIAFGLEREHGALEWVVALPGRALAALAIDDGFVVCDDSGGVRRLDAESGRVVRFWQLMRQHRITLGEPALSACALAPGAMLGAEPEAMAAAREPLLEQLARVLAMSEPRLTDAQRFLSRELAARPEPEATRVLIELVTRHSLDRVLQSEAEDLLATRRNGRESMLAALSEGGGRGEDALPPIAPLGEALAALGEQRAAPLLARQLNQPAHSPNAIARAAVVLEQLASEAEYDELSVFFSLHRTTADSPASVAAVVSIGRTLLRVGGERARALLGVALRDPLTHPEVKAALAGALGERRAGGAAG